MSVVKEWLAERCSLKQQTVLLSALRGCDGIAKEDPSKKLTRALRGVLLRSAHHGSPQQPGTFMSTAGVDLNEEVSYFCNNLDHYPVHWLMHFLHACEIVGYKHPDHLVRDWWHSFYVIACRALHVGVESETSLDYRLRDILKD